MKNIEKILVDNWRHWWRWFSNWAFLLIVFIATVPIPPEALVYVPDEWKIHVMRAVAITGWILRFIKQSAPPTTAE